MYIYICTRFQKRCNLKKICSTYTVCFLIKERLYLTRKKKIYIYLYKSPVYFQITKFLKAGLYIESHNAFCATVSYRTKLRPTIKTCSLDMEELFFICTEQSNLS